MKPINRRTTRPLRGGARPGAHIGKRQSESSAVGEQNVVHQFPDTRALLTHHWRRVKRQHPRYSGLGELPESLLKERREQSPDVLDPQAGLYDDWENLYSASNFPFVIGVTSVQIIPANPLRAYLLVQNKSAGTMFVNFGQGANSVAGIEILAGGSYEFTGGERGGAFVPGDSINVVATLANSQGVLTEGVKLMLGTRAN